MHLSTEYFGLFVFIWNPWQFYPNFEWCRMPRCLSCLIMFTVSHWYPPCKKSKILFLSSNVFQMIEPFTAHYVFALGVARFLSCAHWIIQVSMKVDLVERQENVFLKTSNASSSDVWSLPFSNNFMIHMFRFMILLVSICLCLEEGTCGLQWFFYLKLSKHSSWLTSVIITSRGDALSVSFELLAHAYLGHNELFTK